MSGKGRRRRKKSISFFKSRDGGERIMRGEKWAGGFAIYIFKKLI